MQGEDHGHAALYHVGHRTAGYVGQDDVRVILTSEVVNFDVRIKSFIFGDNFIDHSGGYGIRRVITHVHGQRNGFCRVYNREHHAQC